MVEVITSWELARVFNDVQFAREGGTVQQSEDLGSQNKYGARTYQRTDFHNSTDGEVLALAVKFLNASYESRMRVDSVTVSGVEGDGNDNYLLWGVELGDRLAVLVETPFGWSVERELHVFGIQHSITGSDWVVTFMLDDAQITEFTYWILGDPVFGVLGETTRVA
jgi:hypothetical protein